MRNAGASSALVLVLLAGCGVYAEPIAEQRSRVVYGADNRVQALSSELESATGRVSDSVVALLPNAFLNADGTLASDLPSAGSIYGLCADEPFLDEPAVAFCSGVLIDEDLVLTAGHCLRVLGLRDFSIVFNYAYTHSGQLQVSSDDVYAADEIVAERLDPEGSDRVLDYGLLRLNRAVLGPGRPSPWHAGRLAVGANLTSVGASAGMPLKADPATRIVDAREDSADYFIAQSDTSHGASGGGVFNAQGELLGILARGATDLTPADAGCAKSHQLSRHEAYEHYTRVEAVFEDAQRSGAFITGDTDTDAGVARDLPRPEASCALTRGAPRAQPWFWLVICSALRLARRRHSRQRRRLV